MKFLTEHKTGLIGTAITHGVILLFLVYFGIFNVPPLSIEDGILVNFGDSETGIGLEEPAPGELAPAQNTEEKVTAVPSPLPVAKKIVSTAEKEELATQDIEKTVALESAKKKREAEIVRDLEKERILQEKREQENIERQRQLEEQQRLAQLAAEQKKIGEINSRAKNVFGGGGKGTPDSKSTGQGVTFGPGNQGVPQGSANVDRYGPGGGLGNGISFSLGSRSAQAIPKPSYPGNEEGVVVVQVSVDKNGVVRKAEAGVKGSNTAAPDLLAAARKAALQARFNVDGNAPEFQVGTITYRFRLD